MKKSISNLGKVLDKTEQKNINGGVWENCGGFDSYEVSNCNQCINTILPGAPTLCVHNCCIMAF